MAEARIAVDLAPAPSEEVRRLIEELEAELATLYPAEQRHGLSLEAIFQPHIRFFVARLDGKPAGCGGIAFFAGFAELKRMYVRRALRGRGVGDAIMSRLEEEARRCAIALIRLETGTQSWAAQRFYARMGYRGCAPFEPYASMPAENVAGSVFLEKAL